MERPIERATTERRANTRVATGINRLKAMRAAGLQGSYRSTEWEKRTRQECLDSIKAGERDGTITTAKASEARSLIEKYG